MINRIAFAALASFAIIGSAIAQPIAIVGGKVWTGTSRGTLENGVLIIEDGEITTVGPTGTSIPANATVIEATGKWVTPGIIAAFSSIGLVEVGAESTTNDSAASGSPYSVALNAADGFNPAGTAIDVTRIEGITRIVVAPSPSSKLFAGQGFISDTSGNPTSDIRENAFVYVVMGEAGSGIAGGSRPAAWAQLRTSLEDARSYPTRYITSNDGAALNRTDARALQAAVRGQQTMMIRAHRASDLLNIIDFAAGNPSLDIAIVGGDEGWLVAEELADANIPVIINPFSNLPASFEQLGATSENAARLIAAGVEVAFANLDDDSHQARLALQVAGNAVANGVDHDDALRALTLAPARIFGMTGYGTLTSGNVGDVVVWDGDPLEVTTSPDAVIIAGEVQSLESRQTRLRDRYLTLDESQRPKAYDRP